MLAAAGLIGGCDNASVPSVPSVTVQLSQDSLLYGQSMSVLGLVTDDGDVVEDAAISWSSSNPAILDVDSDGLIFGKGIGAAYVRGEFEGELDSLRARVVLREPFPALRFSVISEGSLGICAQATSGGVYCSTGPSNDTEIDFQRMPGGNDLEFTALFTTLHSQCGFATDQTYWCWGFNGHRHFGIPGMSAGFEATDNPVQGAEGRKFLSLSVGGHSQACGANAADSVVYCVGHNDGDQLGRNTRPAEDGLVAPVSGSLKAIVVSTGNFHTCALDPQNKPHCWGGFATPIGAGVPTPVSTTVEFLTLSAGVSHVCGLSAGGVAHCWGSNASGQVGPGTGGTVSTPLQIQNDVPFSIVRAHFDSTCGVGTDEVLRCWGSFVPFSISESLGEAKREPHVVARGVKFRDVSSNQNYACGITTDGRLVCW